MIETNCPISKEIYQFLPGTCVKRRSISKLYSLKIATHASNVIVLFGASSGPPSTDTNNMDFRTPSFKHASLNSSRDRSARKSSISLRYVMFFTLNSYVCRPVVANRTVFVFFICSINKWDQLTLFPSWNVKIQKIYSIVEVHQNCGLVF